MNMRSVTQRRLTYYVIPVLIGLGGVVFSQQLNHVFWRSLVLLISVSLPLYAGSNLLVRYHTSPMERFGMMMGLLLLLLGAAFSYSGMSDKLAAVEYVPESVIAASRIIGMISLFLGLVVVLVSIMRTGEGIDELAERFRFLAEHISEGFILSTPEGTILLVNQKVLDIFGRDRESVIGSNARDMALSFGFETIARQLDNRAEGVASEYEISWKAGEQERILLINGAPVFNKQGKHSLTMATVRDVTEHRQLTHRVEQYARGLQQLVDEQTRKLHRSQERLRQLLLSMNEGFVTIDLEYRIRFANQQAQTLFNTQEASLIGREIFEFVDGVGRSRLLNLFSKAMEHKPGKGLRQEIEFINGKGPGLSAVVGVAYLNSPEEKYTGYSLVITPIGDLKRMQQQLISRARELERANEELRLHDRAKDSFLSNITHELRTPLTTIQGYIELLLDDHMGGLSEEQRQAMVVMERNARHLLTHINELIEFSRMQIRGIQIAANIYDACAVAREAASAILPAAGDKGIIVSTETSGETLYAWGDRDKITQVLNILLNNAVKFTDRNGTITLRVSQQDIREIRFDVCDTGIGIDPAYHEKIFARFFQVDSSKTRQYEGAGIGLSIAQNIVQAHGGTITLKSALGKGSTFSIQLPDSVFVTDMDPDIGAELLYLRILFVEESAERRQAFSVLPPLNQCTVTYAANGYQVTRWSESEEFDLVIINDAHADVAGETSLRVLRQQPTLAQLPVIVMTNEGGEVIRHAFDRDSGVYFLFKPCSAQAMADKILQAITGKIASMEEALGELAHSGSGKPMAVVIDNDPGFLEWVETALHLQNIEARCATAPGRIFDLFQLKKPEAVFLDADIPARQLSEVLQLYFNGKDTGPVPLYLISGMRNAPIREKGIENVAGILYKPFPISDMTEIIKKVCGTQDARHPEPNGKSS